MLYYWLYEKNHYHWGHGYDRGDRIERMPQL